MHERVVTARLSRNQTHGSPALSRRADGPPVIDTPKTPRQETISRVSSTGDKIGMFDTRTEKFQEWTALHNTRNARIMKVEPLD